jgi:hypothetical protein
MNLQNLLNKYNIKANINMIFDMWNESHRSFHTLSHFNDIYGKINEMYDEGLINESEREKLVLLDLFHDAIDEPTRKDN